MTKVYILLTSVAALALTAPAFAADKEVVKTSTSVSKDSKGNYDEKDKTVKTDASGKTVDEKKVDVDVAGNGDTDKSVTTEHSHKKGMFHHKHSVKTNDTEKTKDGKVTTTHEKDVDGKTVEKTTTTTPKQ